MINWNCLIISDEIDKTDLKIPDKLRIDNIHWNNFDFYNIEDYDVLFLDFGKSISFKRQQRKDLISLIDLKEEQIIFIFASKCSAKVPDQYGRIKDVFDLLHVLWSEIPISSNKEGRKIILINPKNKISRFLFNELKTTFHWEWSVEQKDLPEDSYKLAKNKNGNIISFVLKKGKRFLIIVPQPDVKLKFIENCLKNIEEIKDELYQSGLNITIKKPDWLKDYDLFNKRNLINKKKRFEEEIEKIELYEILLYGYGKPLENAISKIFSYLGFQNIRHTVDQADLICETQNTKIIAEIKGLKSIAYERNISQMYKRYAEEIHKKELTEKSTKQIFICNAHRTERPDDKGSFFDGKVIKASKTHNWGLISTLDFYLALLKIHNGELSKDDVISIIENQTGLLKF